MFKKWNAVRQVKGGYLATCRVMNKLHYFDIGSLFYLQEGQCEC